MGTSLSKAIEALSKLPEDRQETMAQWILDELVEEQRWDSAFTGSLNQLAQLGAKALEEHRTGRTQELDPDSLP
ncbi:MAG: hypothetical protein SGJ24_19905 [Chloroflexota bacterium]|nr:hypothetical protein [Chloroflexota bacterium]